MRMEALIFAQVLWIPATMLFTWQHRLISKMTEKVEAKADISTVTEMKGDIKELLKLLTEHRIEMGRWQGLIEQKQQRS